MCWDHLIFYREITLEDMLFLRDRLFLRALPDFPIAFDHCASTFTGNERKDKVL